MGRSWLVAALVAGGSSLAIAQPGGAAKAPPQPTAAEKAKAGELVKEAIAKSQAGEHAQAIELYKEAYQIVPLPLLLSNLGSEYKAMAKPVEALDYFCQYLKADPTGTNAGYATSEAKALQLELKNPSDDVCAPPPPAATPPPPPPPPHGEPPKQPAGTAPASPGKVLETAGLVVGGAGVVALGLGIYFGVQAGNISDEISNHDPTTPWPDDIKAREAKGQSDENRQVVFLAIGGVAVASGAVLYLLGHAKNSHAEQHQVAVVPVATGDATGFAITGRF